MAGWGALALDSFAAMGGGIKTEEKSSGKSSRALFNTKLTGEPSGTVDFHLCFYYASSSSRAIPCSAYNLTIASSIRLFGQLAPAVIPIVTGRFGSQLSVLTSVLRCKL